MATTQNKNLFYLLYSTDLSVADSGYACSTAIDETNTSFDISVDEAQITDSNGDVLASLDLSSIHEDNLTQYNVETKILQPHSAYLLQGNEYGETYKQQYFEIPEDLSSKEDYYEYCNIKFDLVYKYKDKIYNINVDSSKIRTTYGSFTIVALNLLTTLNADISISIRTFDDTDNNDKQIDYVNFSGTKEGYDFIIRNVQLTPLFSDSENCNGEIGEFEDSPFAVTQITNDDIIDLLNKYLPKYLDSSKNSDGDYVINCDIYKALMKLSLSITDDFDTFVKEMEIIKSEILPYFDEDGNITDEDMFNILMQKYPEIHIKYFCIPFIYYNMNTIFDILTEMEEFIFDLIHSQGPHSCFEDLNRSVNNVKYPNGAFRGILLLPIWPEDENTELCTLWANHVADKLDIEVPVDLNRLSRYFKSPLITNRIPLLFEKAIATVQINALIPDEKQNYIEDYDNLPLNNISSNEGFTNSIDNTFTSGYDNTEYVNNEYHRVPIKEYDFGDIDEDIWVNPNKKTSKKYVDTHDNNNVTNVIGLYKYMEYLSKNDLWLKIGDSYMSLAKADNFLLGTKNLLQSLLIYNPNDIPVKIKYMIFS